MVSGLPSPSSPLRLSIPWLLAYFAVLLLVIAGLLYGRWQAFHVYGSASAQTEWATWRKDVESSQESSPVRRRIPKSAEPPALVLMRDYFGICLAISLLLTSVLFGTLMIFIRGAISESSPCPTSKKPTSDF